MSEDKSPQDNRTREGRLNGDPATKSRDDSNAGAPDPPSRYNSEPESFKPPSAPQSSNPPEFDSARRTIGAAQLMALVSLVIGGVVLSSASIAVAIVGFRKSRHNHGDRSASDSAWVALERTALITLAMSILALAVNIAALMLVYPVMLEMLDSGDYTALWNGADPPRNPNNSFWG